MKELLIQALLDASAHAVRVGLEALEDGNVDKAEARALVVGASQRVAEVLIPGDGGPIEEIVLDAIGDLYDQAAELRATPAQLIERLERVIARGNDKRADRIRRKLLKRGATIPPELQAQPSRPPVAFREPTLAPA